MGLRSALLAAVVIVFAGAPVRAASVDVAGVGFVMGWTASSTAPGAPDVAGYEVWIARSTSPGAPPDAAFARELDAGVVPIAPITGNVGDYVTVKVRAFSAGKTIFSPFSVPSDQVRLLGFVNTPPVAPGQPTIIVRCENAATPTPYIRADGSPGCK